MALARNLQLENDTSVNTGYHTKAQSMSASGGDTIAGLNNSGTGTGKSDSAKGSSLSNISASSIKRTDNGGDDDDSSVFDSSSSDTECDDDSIKRAIDRIPGTLAPGEARVLPNANVKVAVEAIAPGVRPSPAASTIGAIAVHNSSDITFGNKTYIKGQVVIKNIYQDLPSATKPPEPRTWQSSLKTIIKDKPLISFIVMVSLMIVLCAIVAVISILTASEDDLFPDPRPLRLVTRTEWLAQPPREELTDLKLPVNNVIIAHTATEGCTTQAACRLRVRLIQEFHMDGKNYDDITYNFLIGGDGHIYEGRNWHKIGATIPGYNSRSITVAFVGEYNYGGKPTKKQIELLKYLLHFGAKERHLKEGYRIYASEQLDPTVGTGKWLIEALHSLPQFVDKEQNKDERPDHE
ncbi:AGAP005203-PE [Anopheles gambiae str. PEST]|uniref:AGAP005203-PE n=1 Tax=Anopheles gambiae TaxID=7165 RepID=Q5TSR0_ANOGA|nr:AGAP005203-PE [Anopheles gambiae str. PEST]